MLTISVCYYTLARKTSRKTLRTGTFANEHCSGRLLQVRGKTKKGDFAKLLVINPNTLRTYENGRSLPNQDFLARVCVQFSVSPSWLLLGEGPMRVGEKMPGTKVIAPQEKTSAKTERSNEVLLAEVQRERQDLSKENQLLHKEKEVLLREIGDLRAQVARLEERKNRLAVVSEQSVANSGVA